MQDTSSFDKSSVCGNKKPHRMSAIARIPVQMTKSKYNAVDQNEYDS